MKKLFILLFVVVSGATILYGMKRKKPETPSAEQPLKRRKIEAEPFALQKAAKEGDLETVKILLKNSTVVIDEPNPNLHNATPLHAAAHNGHTKIVQLLIDNGADINAKTQYGQTPLHYAAQNGHTEIVKALIQAKAIVNATDKYDFTPLHLAAYHGRTGVVEALIQAGANVHAATQGELTPLYYAAQNGHTEVVKALIQAKANVHVAAQDGLTPLHIAAHNGHTEVVKALIEAKANVHAETLLGDTPLHRAAQNGHAKIVQLLIDKGALYYDNRIKDNVLENRKYNVVKLLNKLINPFIQDIYQVLRLPGAQKDITRYLGKLNLDKRDMEHILGLTDFTDNVFTRYNTINNHAANIKALRGIYRLAKQMNAKSAGRAFWNYYNALKAFDPKLSDDVIRGPLAENISAIY